MIDLRNFLGSTAVVGNDLVYVIDGVPLPEAQAMFSQITSTSATLDGKAIMIFRSTIVAGSLSITLVDGTTASLTVKWQFEGGDPQSQTIQATYQVNPSNQNELDFLETTAPFAKFFIARVPTSDPSVTNTEIYAQDGVMALGAVLEPPSSK